jgi:hypothetical protein
MKSKPSRSKKPLFFDSFALALRSVCAIISFILAWSCTTNRENDRQGVVSGNSRMDNDDETQRAITHMRVCVCVCVCVCVRTEREDE